jgi:hypothetical protein
MLNLKNKRFWHETNFALISWGEISLSHGSKYKDDSFLVLYMVSCGLLAVDRRFRGVSASIIALIMEAVNLWNVTLYGTISQKAIFFKRYQLWLLFSQHLDFIPCLLCSSNIVMLHKKHSVERLMLICLSFSVILRENMVWIRISYLNCLI